MFLENIERKHVSNKRGIQRKQSSKRNKETKSKNKYAKLYIDILSWRDPAKIAFQKAKTRSQTRSMRKKGESREHILP